MVFLPRRLVWNCLFEQCSNRSPNQVNHSDEVPDISIPSCSGSGSLEQAIQAFDSKDSHRRRMRGRCSSNVFSAFRIGASREPSATSSRAVCKKLVARHRAPCFVSASRTQRNISFTRKAVAVASPLSNSSCNAPSYIFWSIKLVAVLPWLALT